MGSTADDLIFEALGWWECACGAVTSETHYYEDRATGQMGHASHPGVRRVAAARCGWRFDDGVVGTLYRCAEAHPHAHDHGSACGTCRWSSTSRGAIPPYDPATANRQTA